MARRVKVEVARKGAGLSSLEPIDAEPFRLAASPGFIWLTVALVWLFSLLPWRVWLPAPDLLLLLDPFVGIVQQAALAFTFLFEFVNTLLALLIETIEIEGVHQLKRGNAGEGKREADEEI